MVQHRLPLQRALTGALVVLLALVAAHYAGAPLPWPPAADWAYNAVEAGAAAVCLLRAARGPERRAWFLLALGIASFCAGDVYYTLAYGDGDAAFPSPADVGYLGFYPAIYAALVLFTRARLKTFARSLWLDGLIGALAVGALGATLLVDPIMASTGGSIGVVATGLAYPLGDGLLLVLVAGAAALTGGARDRRWLVIAAAFAIFAVTDSLYLYKTAAGTYQAERLLDVGWPLAMVVLAVAACMGAAPRRVAGDGGWRTFAVPGISGLVSLGLEIYDHYHRISVPGLWSASLCLLAVLGRLALTFRENLEMVARSQAEATTDPLTGLRNRRALLRDLEDALASRTPRVLALFDLDGFKAYNDTFGHPSGDALLSRLGARLAATVPTGRAYRMGGDEFCVVATCENGNVDAVIAPAAAALHDEGESFAVRASHGAVRLGDEATTVASALQIADQRMYAHKAAGRPVTGGHTAAALLRALHERRPDLGDHDGGVATLAGEVAARLGLDAVEVAEVRVAAELHDIGKVAVPDAILDKPGPLDSDEWAVIRRHTEIGARIIASDATLALVATMVRASHERWDGGGYPDGLAAEEIPQGARIICACDAWDAMVTDRPYRRALAFHEALAELHRCAGSQFDPGVVDTLVAVLTAAPQLRAA